MKRLISLCLVLMVLLLCTLPASAEKGNVLYTEDAGAFVFFPGSEHSLTDLFPNFKDVMPGDRLTQTITIKNDASRNVKVKIYIRSLGAHADSVDFLSQMTLKVDIVDGWMDYMFDAAANETAQLTDWVCLGTLYSGGVVDLDVILGVPVTMDNAFQDQIGYLDWEFMVEEIPVDPSVPQTGDAARPVLYLCLFAGGLIGLLLILLAMRRKKK